MNAELDVTSERGGNAVVELADSDRLRRVLTEASSK